MTVKIAFIAELDEVVVSDTTAEKTLLDRGLNGTEDYTATEDQKKGIDLCVIDVLYRLYTRPDVSEGGYSKSHPDFVRKIQARLLFLAKKHAVAEVLGILEEAGPTIEDASNLW